MTPFQSPDWLPPWPHPILLVVAHYDDEVIGVGGQLARWAPATVLVHVTDSAPADGVDARAAGFESRAAYSSARRAELADALACLPSPPRSCVELGFADRGVTERLDDLVAALDDVIRRTKPAIVVTHAYEGGHPDHDAVAWALRALGGSLSTFALVEFAGYHESASGQLVTNRFEDGAGTIVLAPEERLRKQRMMASFRTQRRVLAPFRCERESIRLAGPVDFTAPPPSGRVWFDRLGWNVTGAAWRGAVARVARGITARDTIR
jgi:LmbE family N-acetylglucosaminyl deacetylase